MRRFYCGAGAENTPVTSVDRIAVGSGEPGLVARKLSISISTSSPATTRTTPNGERRYAESAIDQQELREI